MYMQLGHPLSAAQVEIVVVLGSATRKLTSFSLLGYQILVAL